MIFDYLGGVSILTEFSTYPLFGYRNTVDPGLLAHLVVVPPKMVEHSFWHEKCFLSTYTSDKSPTYTVVIPLALLSQLADMLPQCSHPTGAAAVAQPVADPLLSVGNEVTP